MNRRSHPIVTLLRHELRMLLRDRRTVVFSILLPLAVMPLLLFSSRAVEDRRERKHQETAYAFAIARDHGEVARTLLASRPDVDPDQPGPEMVEHRVADAVASLESLDIHFFLQVFAPGEPAPPGSAATAAAPRSPESRDVPLIRIAYRGDQDLSGFGARRMEELLEGVRAERREGLLTERGLAIPADGILAVHETDVASGAQVSGSLLGRFLTSMLLMFLLSGGAVIATDSIAGEKERGTLETLLTTAAERSHIVIAKLLSIFTVAMVITLIQVANLLVYVGLKIIPLPRDFVLEISLAGGCVLVLLFLPVAALTSSVLLLISGVARSYKEAQLYFFPAFLLGLLPSLAAAIPTIQLRSAVVVVPLANTAVAVREVLSGRYDWPFLAATLAVTMAAAWFGVLAAIRSLSVERLITASDHDEADILGGHSLFARHVLYWYAMIWTIVLVAATNLEMLGGIRPQILFNVILMFGGGSVVMMYRYRLSPRVTLALSWPHPIVWLGVLVGVPAGFVTALGVHHLASLFLPIPVEMLRAFGELFETSAMPTWQLYLLVAIAPGIFEEVAFRGVLLHGLHRRFHPTLVCLLVAAIFAVFHFDLFRLIPVFFLGLLLTTVTMLSGSLFPAIVWHALNNALALFAGQALEELEIRLYLAAAAVLAMSLWLVYRNRTPYPGLRWRGQR